jgi:hypothetical protein
MGFEIPQPIAHGEVEESQGRIFETHDKGIADRTHRSALASRTTEVDSLYRPVPTPLPDRGVAGHRTHHQLIVRQAEEALHRGRVTHGPAHPMTRQVGCHDFREAVLEIRFESPSPGKSLVRNLSIAEPPIDLGQPDDDGEVRWAGLEGRGEQLARLIEVLDTLSRACAREKSQTALSPHGVRRLTNLIDQIEGIDGPIRVVEK